MVDKSKSSDTDFPTEEERAYAPINEDTEQMTVDPLTGQPPLPPEEVTRNLPDSNGGMTEGGAVFPVDDADSSSPDNRE